MLPANFAAELTITVINLDSEKTNCWGKRRLLYSGNLSLVIKFFKCLEEIILLSFLMCAKVVARCRFD